MGDLFYVSNQLVEYLHEANYGNGLAEAYCDVDYPSQRWFQLLNGSQKTVWTSLERRGWSKDFLLSCIREAENKIGVSTTVTVEHLEGIDVRNSLRLLFEQHIASAQILVLLFSLIIRVNELTSKTNPRRIHYDMNMAIHLANKSNTRYMMTRNNVVVDVTPKDSEDLTSRSAFDRLQCIGVLADCVPSLIPYNPHSKTDDWGCTLISFLHMSTFFRIPNSVLTDDERYILKQPSIIKENASVVYYIQRLLDTHIRRETGVKVV